jgi:hypothetical protein
MAAIANSAALVGKDRGYVVWGVRDADHKIVGTTFPPLSEKVRDKRSRTGLRLNDTRRSISESMKAWRKVRPWSFLRFQLPRPHWSIPGFRPHPCRFVQEEATRPCAEGACGLFCAGSFELGIGHASATPTARARGGRGSVSRRTWIRQPFAAVGTDREIGGLRPSGPMLESTRCSLPGICHRSVTRGRSRASGTD